MFVISSADENVVVSCCRGRKGDGWGEVRRRFRSREILVGSFISPGEPNQTLTLPSNRTCEADDWWN